MAPASRRPADSDFYQQRLKAWQPILTPKWAIITFVTIGVAFVAIGFGLKAASDNVVELSVQYDGDATPSNLASCHIEPGANASAGLCNIRFTAPSLMVAPVYLYYQLDNFYQNHRRYVSSRSDTQLAGTLYTSSSDISACTPLQMLNNSLLDPCGLIAYSVFNDSFTTSSVAMSETGIAWPTDLSKFVDLTPAQKASAEAATGNGITWLSDFAPTIANVSNEHFIVWMRVAALPSFRKLYGIINSDIPAGAVVAFDVLPQYPVTGFGGRKSLVLSTTSFMGGKNAFLGIAYIVVGFVCILLAFLFAVRQLVGGRRLGDTTFLVWNGNR